MNTFEISGALASIETAELNDGRTVMNIRVAATDHKFKDRVEILHVGCYRFGVQSFLTQHAEVGQMVRVSGAFRPVGTPTAGRESRRVMNLIAHTVEILPDRPSRDELTAIRSLDDKAATEERS